MKKLIQLLAMAAAGMPEPLSVDVDALLASTPRRPRRSTAKPSDPHAAERAKHRKARTFVAADGFTYPAGLCGFVPKSARLDPARGRVR